MPNTTSEDTSEDRSQAASLNARDERSGDTGEADAGEPWYAAGLPFTCSQCGDCCTGTPGAVWVSDEELAAIAAELGKPVGEIRLLHTKLIAGRWSLRDDPNGDCVFLDPQTRRCQVYAARPMQCRAWPFWPSNIATKESWNRTCEVCPGSGRGMLHTLEVIQKQATVGDI